MRTLLLHVATVRSFAHMPLGISDRNSSNTVILLHFTRYLWNTNKTLIGAYRNKTFETFRGEFKFGS